jgi:integrase
MRPPAAIPEGTVRWLIAAFKSSPEYHRLSAHTRYHYALLLDRLAPIAGFRVDEIKRRHIRALRDKMVATPRTADFFVQAVRRAFALAVDDEWIETNPAAEIKPIGKCESYVAWSDEECTRFELAIAEAHVPEWAATAYMLARYTAQRRGDILRLTWAAYDGRAISLVQGKTKAALTIPVHSRLKAHLDAAPRDALYIVATPSGRPFDARNFTKAFRVVLDGLGLAGRHLHGLRHKTASDLAERGSEEAEIKSVTGHRSSESVELYTRAARQKRLAVRAIAKLEDGDG